MRLMKFLSLPLRFLITAVLSATILVALPIAPPAQAETTAAWRDASFGDEYDASDLGSVNSGAYIDRSVKGFFASPACQIMAFGPSKPGATDGLCTNDPNKVGLLNQRSVVGVVSGYIAAMYVTPPADLALWWSDTAQSLGFAPRRAYAQGVGFSGFAALLPVWKAFRNIAYMLLAVIMIVIGFMVMLRKKIDPKTVVTVQNAIPRIVITLLLITFSYAIVGVLVDLMYVSISMIVVFFERAGLLRPIESGLPTLAAMSGLDTNQKLYTSGGIFAVIGNSLRPAAFGGDGTGLIDLTLKIFGMDTNFWRTVQAGGLIGALGLLALNAGPIAASVPAFAAIPVLLAFLIALAMLFLIIRLFIFFLGAYIQIIISLIFAPIQLIGEALPGSNAFSSWFKNLIANLIVFPIGAAIFMLSNIFAYISTQTGALITLPYTPLMSASVTSIGALLSIGILFSLPSIAGGVRESLKAKPFVSAGPEGVVGALGQPVNIAMQMINMWTSHQTLQAMRGQNEHKGK